MDRGIPGLVDRVVVMSRKADRLPPQLQKWVEARHRYRLSHAQVEMARELGLNPANFGQLANHRQEPWKAPLPVIIEDLYLQRFGRALPEIVVPVEERHRQDQQRKAARRAARAARAQASVFHRG